jgi:hypothetical protein
MVSLGCAPNAPLARTYVCSAVLACSAVERVETLRNGGMVHYWPLEARSACHVGARVPIKRRVCAGDGILWLIAVMRGRRGHHEAYKGEHCEAKLPLSNCWRAWE